MNYEVIQIEYHETIHVLTINRPEALNAIDSRVMNELKRYFETVPYNSDVRGIILTGQGKKAFVAGADIKALVEATPDAATDLAQFGYQTFSMIENCPVPVVAAINGFALGGGCELAMACHVRIAGEHARLGQPEINLGLLPGYGGTQRLTRLIGKTKALELLLTGATITAQEALQLGLVNKVVPSGEEVSSARQMLDIMVQKAPVAAKYIIELVNLSVRDPKFGFQKEVKRFGDCFRTHDAREGMKAFLEKRKPEFRGE